MSLRNFIGLVLLSIVAAGPPQVVRFANADWPHWRGPHQNGIAETIDLVSGFDPDGGDGSNLLWKNANAGGISTPVISNGRLYTIVRDKPGTSQEAEKVICLDALSGRQLWQNVYNVFLSDVPAERVGWSHVTCDPATGNIFAMGACCLLQSIDGQTGKTLWSRSLSEEFGMLSTYGGRTNTPVVFENLVVISGVTTGWDQTAKPAHRFLAFDSTSGELVWITSTNPYPEDTTYSTPVVAIINGQPQLIAGAGDGFIYGFQPRTGKLLWRESISRRGVNTTAVVDDQGHVFITHGEENPTGTTMGAVVKIDAKKAAIDSASAEVWRTEEIAAGKSSPLLLGNRLYVVEDSAKLHVLDTESGEEIGRGLKLGTSMRGSLIYGSSHIYGCTATGIFHIMRPSDDGVESVFKLRLPSGHEVGGSLAVDQGRIYLPTTAGLYCLSSETTDKTLSPVAAATTAQPPVQDIQVSHLQLVPAEAIVTGGSKSPLQINAYNAAGQRLTTPKNVMYTVTGGGEVDSDNRFLTPANGQHFAAVVTATVGDKSASARLRVVPELPWRFDFSDNAVPITWIGARYRYEPTKVDGNPAIVKSTTIPKGTRSQSWIGPPSMHDYTISADVKAGSGAKLPDIGVIGQRYTLDLMGESQQLQIRTWPAQLRMARTVSFQWKPDTWYTIKLQASVENDQAVLRGKVWPRDQSEPESWTVTATDPASNLVGSPGLFGNATNAEIVIDNVSVIANQ